MVTAGIPPRFALQLYTVRRELAAAPEKTLERVRASGFSAVEVAPLAEGLSAGEMSRMLRAFELEVVGIHFDLPTGQHAQDVADLAGAFDCRRVIWHGWPRDPAFDRADDLDGLVGRFNEAAELTRGLGIEFGIHNHWWEFEPVAGELAFRRMLAKMVATVFWELDVYWVQTAGCDPSKILEELGGRVKMLHLKDGPALMGEPMTALGDGVVDLRAILNELPEAVDALVLEMDECATDIWTAMERSAGFLRNYRGTGEIRIGHG